MPDCKPTASSSTESDRKLTEVHVTRAESTRQGGPAKVCKWTDIRSGSMSYYAILEFPDTSEVEIAPYNWLKTTNAAYWPPFKSMDAVRKAVEDCVPADTKIWPLYKVRIIRLCDDYHKARSKLDKSQYTSDLTSDEEGVEMKRRPVKRPAWLSVNEDFEVDMLEESGNESSDEEIVNAQGPQRGICTPGTGAFAVPLKKRVVHTKTPTPPPPPSFATPHSPVVQAAGNTLPPTKKRKGIFNALPKAPLPPPPPSFPSPPTPARAFTRVPMTAAEKEILRALSRLEQKVDALEAEQKELRKVIAARPQGLDEDNEDEVPFPLRDVADIDSIEALLLCSAKRKALVTRLAGIGGTNLKDTVKRIMSHILTHEVSLNFNWLGKTGGNTIGTTTKKGFGLLNLAKVVTGAVVQNPLFVATESQVEQQIKTWLKNASDRNGGRKNRHKSTGFAV